VLVIRKMEMTNWKVTSALRIRLPPFWAPIIPFRTFTGRKLLRYKAG